MYNIFTAGHFEFHMNPGDEVGLDNLWASEPASHARQTCEALRLA